MHSQNHAPNHNPNPQFNTSPQGASAPKPAVVVAVPSVAAVGGGGGGGGVNVEGGHANGSASQASAPAGAQPPESEGDVPHDDLDGGGDGVGGGDADGGGDEEKVDGQGEQHGHNPGYHNNNHVNYRRDKLNNRALHKEAISFTLERAVRVREAEAQLGAKLQDFKQTIPRERQRNTMIKLLATKLQAQPQHIPAVSSLSRAVLPSERYKLSLVYIFANATEANKVRNKLTTAGVETTVDKPFVATVESHGWNIQHSPEMINQWLRKVRDKLGLDGMMCTHMLKSNRGTAQFMLPSYLLPNIFNLNKTNGGIAIRKWSLVKVKSKEERLLCDNCWERGHNNYHGDCKAVHVCGRCGGRDTCEYERQCARPLEPAFCPHPAHNEEEAKGHSVFMCDKYQKARVEMKQGRAESFGNAKPTFTSPSHTHFTQSQSHSNSSNTQKQQPKKPPTTHLSWGPKPGVLAGDEKEAAPPNPNQLNAIERLRAEYELQLQKKDQEIAQLKQTVAETVQKHTELTLNFTKMQAEVKAASLQSKSERDDLKLAIEALQKDMYLVKGVALSEAVAKAAPMGREEAKQVAPPNPSPAVPQVAQSESKIQPVVGEDEDNDHTMGVPSSSLSGIQLASNKKTKKQTKKNNKQPTKPAEEPQNSSKGKATTHNPLTQKATTEQVSFHKTPEQKQNKHSSSSSVKLLEAKNPTNAKLLNRVAHALHERLYHFPKDFSPVTSKVADEFILTTSKSLHSKHKDTSETLNVDLLGSEMHALLQPIFQRLPKQCSKITAAMLVASLSDPAVYFS
jgi:hypothetical protein